MQSQKSSLVVRNLTSGLTAFEAGLRFADGLKCVCYKKRSTTEVEGR